MMFELYVLKYNFKNDLYRRHCIKSLGWINYLTELVPSPKQTKKYALDFVAPRNNPRATSYRRDCIKSLTWINYLTELVPSPRQTSKKCH